MSPVFIFDLVLLAVLICIVIRGCVKGFFKTLFGSLRLVFSVIAAYFLGKPVGEFLDSKFIYGWTYNGVYAKIHELYESAAEAFDVNKILALFPKFLISDELRAELENTNETGEELVKLASDSISGVISHFISMIVAYVLVFIVAFIVLWILIKIFGKIIHKIPVIGTVDHILGAALGLLIGWILMSLVCSLFRFFMADNEFYTNSHVLKFFAENPITKYISFLDFYAFLSKIIPNK